MMRPPAYLPGLYHGPHPCARASGPAISNPAVAIERMANARTIRVFRNMACPWNFGLVTILSRSTVAGRPSQGLSGFEADTGHGEKEFRHGTCPRSTRSLEG